MLLYRAIASIRGSLHGDEVAVFFHAPSDRSRWAVLQSLLSQAWAVPTDQVEAYNFDSECELLDRAGGAVATGDARLFEVGWCNGFPLYSAPERTQMFVRPSVLRRLQAGLDAAWVLDLNRQAEERRRQAVVTGAGAERRAA